MKKYLTVFFVIFCFYLYPETVSQEEFLRTVVEKQFSIFSDCVSAFCYLYKINVQDKFDTNVKNLKENIKHFPKKYSQDEKLTFGDFSLFAMQYLKLKSGMFYMAGKSPRYAIRELILLDLIPYNTSEWEKMSGLDLISYIQKVVDYEEKLNKK